MTSERYTLILDYRGGTYLSQIMATSIQDVQNRVNEAIGWDLIAPKPTHRKIEVLDDIPPTPIEGLENVWCLSGTIGRSGAIIHVVKTCP